MKKNLHACQNYLSCRQTVHAILTQSLAHGHRCVLVRSFLTPVAEGVKIHTSFSPFMIGHMFWGTKGELQTRSKTDLSPTKKYRIAFFSQFYCQKTSSWCESLCYFDINHQHTLNYLCKIMVYSLLALEIAIEIFFYLLRDLIAAVVENSFPPVGNCLARGRKVFNEKRARDPRGKNNLQKY